MKIGSKGDYGLRALIELAEHFETGGVTQAKDIAERQAIPKDYLSLIMVDLRKAGLIESVRGPGGGYKLARAPEEITMGAALRSLEGPVSLIDCATDMGFTQCSISLRCRMRHVWIEANRAVAAILDRTTIADLRGPRDVSAPKVEESRPTNLNMPEGLKFQI